MSTDAKAPLLMAIDQGTTSSRAIVFRPTGEIVRIEQQEFPQHYPGDGWVEHEPEDIWRTSLKVAQNAFKVVDGTEGEVSTIGIANQRETTLLWERESGEAIHRAIVWQDRRTANDCQALKDAGAEPLVMSKSGLLLDPYFSASKIKWMLDHVEGARARAEAGELAFGTVDSFLLWRLTGGQAHATDATNASRTALFNIHEGDWDTELLKLFEVPPQVLPGVKDSAASYGVTIPEWFGRPIPINALVGDQQAAAVGQGCFHAGDVKSTYGTGCFVLAHTGEKAIAPSAGLLSTIALQLNGKRTYATEGSIFVTGAAVQWLRDGIGLIESAGEVEALAESIDDTGGVYVVPAFTGLGAPHWAPDARGLICGITRATGRTEIVRATLESVAYQTYDLFSGFAETGVPISSLKVDGGMVANNWLCQFLADMLDQDVARSAVKETTALGAAALAGLSAGIIESTEHIAQIAGVDRVFSPNLPVQDRDSLLNGWARAIERTVDK